MLAGSPSKAEVIKAFSIYRRKILAEVAFLLGEPDSERKLAEASTQLITSGKPIQLVGEGSVELTHLKNSATLRVLALKGYTADVNALTAAEVLVLIDILKKQK